MRRTLVTSPCRLFVLVSWLVLTLAAAGAAGYAIWQLTGTTGHFAAHDLASPTDSGHHKPTATIALTPKVIRLTPDPPSAEIARGSTPSPTPTSERDRTTRPVPPRPTPSPTPAAPELVINGSFEAGPAAWYLENGAGPVAATTAVDGPMVLQIPSGGGYADQHIAAAAGETYRLIGSGRVTAEGDAGMLGVVYRDAAGVRLTTLEPPPLVFTRTRFRAKRLTFTVPAGVVDVLVYAYKEPGPGQLEADAISVRHVDEP